MGKTSQFTSSQHISEDFKTHCIIIIPSTHNLQCTYSKLPNFSTKIPIYPTLVTFSYNSVTVSLTSSACSLDPASSSKPQIHTGSFSLSLCIKLYGMKLTVEFLGNPQSIWMSLNGGEGNAKLFLQE
jgi:hypothetical protein